MGTSEQNRPQPSIVFIDESLIDRVPQEEFVNSTVVTINHQSDPIDQMTDALSGLSNVEVVRIISHGRDGTLIFGDTLIGENQLRIHERQLNGWANALKPDGDILLYGCSVASTEVGRQFVARFGSMTQADVAASSNPTGARGDLILEYGSGPVQGSLVATQTAWEASVSFR